jgi:hypothetical protein
MPEGMEARDIGSGGAGGAGGGVHTPTLTHHNQRG